jgi:hypothetical protein
MRSHSRFTPAVLAGYLLILLIAPSLPATTVVPVTDAELYERSDVVVRGIVRSTSVGEAANGDPETVVTIDPVEVVKGGLAGALVLHQAGGTLPDGRFFRLWGRPEYTPGREVVVFAIARPEGNHTTAEMLLGKLDVMEDDAKNQFAISALAGDLTPEGVEVKTVRTRGKRETMAVDSTGGPRDLTRLMDFLRNGAKGPELVAGRPTGELKPTIHFRPEREISPNWANIGSLWRYNNGASAGWVLDGVANITGGGAAEATRALATWTNDPTSTINHFVGGSNPIHLNAMTSSCGWNSCLTGGGVIGCGGPRGGGSHSWRGENYATITGGEVWLRCYATTNLFGSVITESVILHELGHTLGLGHSDQDASSHDACRGDESAATMRSSVQNRTTLGSDDQDAVRWLYGDGGNHCSSPPPPSCTAPSITAQPTSRSINQGQSTTLSVSAGGTTPLSYQWYTGASGNTAAPVSGGTSASLTVTPSATTSYWVMATNACGAANSAAATVTVTVTAPPPSGIRGDFNGDGRPDLLWRNYSTGENYLWLMDGVRRSGAASLPLVSDVRWRIESVADFNGDNRSDILWRHSSTGENYVWLMSGTTQTGGVGLAQVSDTRWRVGGVGDLNGDNRPDILWRHSSTGENYVWLMNGTTRTSGVSLAPVSGSSWEIGGVGDLNGDSRSDIIWRNGATGENYVWWMNGLTRTGGGSLSPVSDSRWKIESIVDLNLDGRGDLVWRNSGTGENYAWLMNGTTVASGQSIMPVPTTWSIGGTR